MINAILIVVTAIIWFLVGIFFITLTMNAKLKDIEAERYNAEQRAVTHFRKLQKIENIVNEGEKKKTYALLTIEKIKVVLEDKK